MRQAISAYPNVQMVNIGVDVGYILLPSNRDFSGKNINADTQVIRDALRSVNTATTDNWILYLRVNTGGSMCQILVGLSEGKVGRFVNQHQRPDGA